MFGIRIVTRKGLEKIKQDAENQAIVDLIALLQRKDRIYLEPVTLVGNDQMIQDCVFLGVGGVALNIKTLKVALAEAAARKTSSSENEGGL